MLKNGEITPFYQPIIDNKTGQIIKFEALARVILNGKIIPPSEFINESKKAKVYEQITKVMINKVFRDFHDIKEFSVSINVSNQDVFSERIFRTIEKGLKNLNYPENIVFEITESGKIPNYEQLRIFTNMVKKYNAKISIDDFGTDYSNFTHLKNIDADFLKIDGQFIKNINTEKRDYLIVEALVSICRELGVKIIAEYVENKQVFDVVNCLGVGYSQGYHFGAPMSMKELIEKKVIL